MRFDIMIQVKGVTKLGHEKTPEEFAANIGKIINRFEFLLNPTSNVMINIGETYRNGCALDIPGLVKNAIKEHTGLTYKDTLIWSKPTLILKAKRCIDL